MSRTNAILAGVVAFLGVLVVGVAVTAALERVIWPSLLVGIPAGIVAGVVLGVLAYRLLERRNRPAA